MDSRKIRRINKKSIAGAGPRYTPQIESGAPNIEIEELTLSKSYRDKVLGLKSDFDEAQREANDEITNLYRKGLLNELSELLSNLSAEKAGSSRHTLRKIKNRVAIINESNNKYRSELHEQQHQAEEYSEEWRVINNKLGDLRKFESTFREVSKFFYSNSLELINNNKMLLLGEWGTGKTHTLCDLTKNLTDKNVTTIFFLAHHLKSGANPLESISEKFGPTYTLKKLLEDLNRVGKTNNSRSLIIVDGINESDRKNWKKYIRQIAAEIGKYENVALLLSCRTPFDKQIFSKSASELFTTIYHRGFSEIEFDAQKSFFQYYNIPTPHFPLMTPEFSRPLFLKILCHTLSGKTLTTRSRWLKEISSGQKTMTKIFEDFVKEIGKDVEETHSLAQGTCWRILKEHNTGAETTGVAVTMADQGKDYLTHSECLNVVQKVTGRNKTLSRQILISLYNTGLLVEDYMWQESERQDIVRFPYQRFSDHLIARYLLKKHLDTSNENSIRRSFYSNKPLGAIFSVDPHGYVYNMPGLATAIATEFPVWIKRVLPEEERELVFYLPKKQRLLNPYKEIFLDGVMWRSKDSFSKQTDDIFGQLLNRLNDYQKRGVLETLVTLACRQNHPYSASRLYSYLSRKNIADRDLMWSEFIRNSYEESVVQKVLDWSTKIEADFNDKIVAENYITLLSLFLTTTDRNKRDQATRALVLIGEKTPEILFKHTIYTFKFNDPYVAERMLAACYGGINETLGICIFITHQ